MTNENFIPIATLCTHYKVEMSFFNELNETGLIEIITIEQSPCIHEEMISDLDKMLRIHEDLNINPAGIDTVLNLLERIDILKNELSFARKRLRLYED